MHSAKAVLKERAILLLVFGAIVTSFGVWIAIAGKPQSFRQLTGYHSETADFFFRYFTHFGDGIFIVALAALLAVFRKYLLSIGIAGGYLVSGIFAQLGKRLLNMPRPKAFFESLGESVYQIPGIDIHMSKSFPSGHTASVFALAIFLIFVLPYRWYSWLLMLAAFVVGYSRIYLSQHFPADVWAGAVIGAFSACLVFFIVKKIKNPGLRNILEG